MSVDKKILLFKDTSDKFVRKSRELVRGDIVMHSEKKLTGAVERIGYTLLKAIQNEVVTFSTQEQLEDHAQEIATEIYSRYSAKRKEKLYKDFSEKNKRSNNTFDIDKQVEGKLINEETKLRNIAYREAWKDTLQKNMQGKLDFNFSGNSVLRNAEVSVSNKTKIWEDIKQIQHKSHIWTEEYFNEKTGRIEIKEVSASLFPYAEYFREGKGNDNIISISLNSKMIHAVLFLNSNYLKINREHLLSIKSGNGMRLYEILVDLANSLHEKQFSFEELQGQFDTEYRDFFSFKKQLIDFNLKKINEKLETTITYRNIKEGRRIVAIIFEISPDDKLILKGFNKYTQEIEGEIVDIKESFGYYIALIIYFKNPKKIKNIENYSRKVNALIQKGEWQFTDKKEEILYKEYIKNLEAISEIKQLLNKYDDLIGNKIYFDEELLVLTETLTKTKLSRNAIGSLTILYKDYISQIDSNHPTLPGIFYDNTEIDSPLTIFDTMPFDFNPVPNMKIKITVDNFEKYDQHIKSAIKQNKFDAFKFTSLDKKEIFFLHYDVQQNNKHKTVGTELIDGTITIPSNDDIDFIIDMFLTKQKNINSNYENNLTVEENRNNIRIITDSGYSIDDIAAVINWLFSVKGDWFRPNVYDTNKLNEKFEHLVGYTKSFRNDRYKLLEDVSIFDYYERY